MRKYLTCAYFYTGLPGHYIVVNSVLSIVKLFYLLHNRSQFDGNPQYYYSEDYKRKSLPSEGDSGVALDHHKRSMVFSGYNSLLSVEPSNPDLSISTTSGTFTYSITN